MTEVRGVIYTNFNVTECVKKCNFFHFFATWKNQQFCDLLSENLGLKVCFCTLLGCLYIRIKS